MGGCFYGFDLRPGRGPQDDDGIRDAFWDWLEEHLDRLAQRDARFVAALREYLRVLGMPGKDLGVTREGKRVGFVAGLEDCSGAAETAMLAALHVFDRLTVEDAKGLRAALEAAGATPVLRSADRSKDAARARFFTYRGRIAQPVASWLDEDFQEHRGLAVMWDPLKLEEPALIAVARFPEEERSKLERLARAKKCFCPVCTPRAPFEFKGRGLPRFAPVAPTRTRAAPWKLEVAFHNVAATRTRGRVGEVEVESFEPLPGPVLRAARREIRLLEKNGENTFPSQDLAMKAVAKVLRSARAQVRKRR